MSAPGGARASVRTPKYYRRLAAYEAADPWAHAMADWSFHLIKKYSVQIEAAALLDLGCGAGGFVERFRSNARVRIGLDIDRTALQVAAQRGSAVFGLAAAERLPISDASVDVITSHDVLQHAPAGAFSEAARALRPGGLLVVRTAARRGLLWKKHLDSDDYRQWTPDELRRLCEESNLEVRLLTRANWLPSLARDLAALFREERPQGDVGLPPPPQDANWKQALLRLYWRTERKLALLGFRSPWGHSLLLAATRK